MRLTVEVVPSSIPSHGPIRTLKRFHSQGRFAMTRLAVLALLAGIFLSTSCVVPRDTAKHAAPGQVQKATGYNPASGKVNVKR